MLSLENLRHFLIGVELLAPADENISRFPLYYYDAVASARRIMEGRLAMQVHPDDLETLMNFIPFVYERMESFLGGSFSIADKTGKVFLFLDKTLMSQLSEYEQKALLAGYFVISERTKQDYRNLGHFSQGPTFYDVSRLLFYDKFRNDYLQQRYYFQEIDKLVLRLGVSPKDLLSLHQKSTLLGLSNWSDVFDFGRFARWFFRLRFLFSSKGRGYLRRRVDIQQNY